MKRAILLLDACSLLLLGFGFVLVVKSTQCTGHFKCVAGPSLGVGEILFIVGVFMLLFSWLLGLIATARLGRWGWLIEVFLLGPLGALIYGIAGPTTSRTA